MPPYILFWQKRTAVFLQRFYDIIFLIPKTFLTSRENYFAKSIPPCPYLNFSCINHFIFGCSILCPYYAIFSNTNALPFLASQIPSICTLKTGGIVLILLPILHEIWINVYLRGPLQYRRQHTFTNGAHTLLVLLVEIPGSLALYLGIPLW